VAKITGSHPLTGQTKGQSLITNSISLGKPSDLAGG